MYEFKPYEVIENHNVPLTDAVKRQILGGETAMWSEQVKCNLYIEQARKRAIPPSRAL